MNAQACSKQDVSPDIYNPETGEIGHLSASAGTFLLRRAHYFSEAGGADDAGYELSFSAEQQLTLANFVSDGDSDTQKKIIIHNLRMMINLARQYTNRGMTFSDLVREGNLGLTYALEKFEVKNGVCFSTYATQCISQYIERAIMNQTNSPVAFEPKPAHVLSS
jgi:hypothetical protein